ncbi:response regulator transcription factor [Mucilaginibacter limnophilus]|uniref:Response regulator transcription factor n=1 Tax=Mucilaginibacter limnophilus TaxID=1932778 RepID=A0A3S2UJJ6_9SPHI|nr:LytTR family DNA-binding domain-containing protein [Mucilaginibacter limnophilus]RVT98410.1 response regulator transcription factor [Mucilaginibacter limnophilus]
MDILIIEDEPNAARQLQGMIAACRPLARFGPLIDSLRDAVSYLGDGHSPDLIFLDIHLADGHAFDLFERVDIPCPVIFTTAYDQYAVKAFEVNSLDYLLKPMLEERVRKALDKFDLHCSIRQPGKLDETYLGRLQSLLSAGNNNYRQSFLIPYRDKLLPVQVKDFAWFEIKQGVVSGTRLDGTFHLLEERSLDELTKLLDPRQFYRANRQFLINKAALKEVVHYFNGKLLVRLHPEPSDKVIISREKVTQFKSWVTA